MEKTKIAVVSSRCPAQLFVASLRELSILASRRAQSLSSSWQASNELCVSDVKTFVRQALKGARFEGDGPLGNPEDPLSQNFFLKENARTNAVSMHAGGTLRITFGGQVLSDEIRLRDCVSTASQASFADDPSEPVRFYFDILPNAESASSVSENSTSSKPAHRAQFLTHNPMSMYHGHQFYPSYPHYGLDSRIHNFQMPRVTQLGARTSPSSAPAAVAHDPPHAHQPPDMHAQQQQPFMQPQPGIPYVPPPGMHPAHMGGGFPFMPADMPYPHAQLYPQGLMFAPAQAEMVAPQVNALPVVDVQDAEQVADDTDAVPRPQQRRQQQQPRQRRIIARVRVHWLDAMLGIRLMFFVVVFSRGQPWTSWRSMFLVMFAICFYLYKTRILLWFVYVLAPQFVLQRITPVPRGARRRRPARNRGNANGDANANANANAGENDGLRRRPNAVAPPDGGDQQPVADAAQPPRAAVVRERTGLLVNIEKFVIGILVSLIPAIQVRRFQAPQQNQDGYAPPAANEDVAQEQIHNDERMARELQERMAREDGEDVGLGALGVVQADEADEDDEDGDQAQQQPPAIPVA